MGVKVDLDLLQKTKIDIEADLLKHSKLVAEELLKIDDVRAWVIQTAVASYPCNNKGTYAQKLCDLEGIDLPKSDKSNKYVLNKASLLTLPESAIKDFFNIW